MRETLLSVGIDIGTSTTQLVASRLTLENRAAPFSVPRIAITGREVVYRSGIHFTPLLSDSVIDAAGVRDIVAGEYREAGLRREEVETGAVIITGETARKENAREVLSALSDFAGDFVVATAGPDLESILAARGAGADEYSREHGCELLHFDIGGGTSNGALFLSGALKDTCCLDIGGRLIKVAEDGTVTYRSPALEEWMGPELLSPLREPGQSRSRHRKGVILFGGCGRLHVVAPGGLEGIWRDWAAAGSGHPEETGKGGASAAPGSGDHPGHGDRGGGPLGGGVGLHHLLP